MGIWFGVREQLLQRKLTEKLLKSHFFSSVLNDKNVFFWFCYCGGKGENVVSTSLETRSCLLFLPWICQEGNKKRNNNNKIIELTARVRSTQWTSDQFTRFNGLENTLEFLISELTTQTKVWSIEHAIFKGHSSWLHIIWLATCRDKIYLWLSCFDAITVWTIYDVAVSAVDRYRTVIYTKNIKAVYEREGYRFCEVYCLVLDLNQMAFALKSTFHQATIDRISERIGCISNCFVIFFQLSWLATSSQGCSTGRKEKTLGMNVRP